MAEGARSDEITLGVLTAVEADAEISQRDLSSELGVALGLANAYLKSCVRKGYIKIKAVPRKRYAYFLTPRGFSEKARLTGQYLTSSLKFFRRARDQMNGIMRVCSEKGWRRVALAGATELAEIATLTRHDHDLILVGVVDAARGPGSRFCGLPVVDRLAALGQVDAVVVTHTTNFEEIFASLKAEIDEDRIFAPRLVKVRAKSVGEEHPGSDERSSITRSRGRG